MLLCRSTDWLKNFLFLIDNKTNLASALTNKFCNYRSLLHAINNNIIASKTETNEWILNVDSPLALISIKIFINIPLTELRFQVHWQTCSAIAFTSLVGLQRVYAIWHRKFKYLDTVIWHFPSSRNYLLT